ncbi:uncharacterized protein LY89DRAFT_743770 [Mollisia scopiformis]|uniref:Uncharacterized protein n=1 Tax=Mollisia scopiformis TaxID=149040 RepID=A0A132B297_MOLSC|nr:uncharacterized protein LY89DRAFT_743770 [Mollisia scopiformis]KUJ06441.1 hypothetical protein LY89DRAFT_743770 [Mollisia scopiformis]
MRVVNDQESGLVPETMADARSRALKLTILVAILRTVQLTLGLNILFLTGVGASVFQGDFIFIRSRWFPKSNFNWCHRFVTFSRVPHPILTNFTGVLEIITLIFWLSTFSLLVWECMDGDQTFAVPGDSGEQQLVTYVSASNLKSAIKGLKAATGLACINWIAFAVIPTQYDRKGITAAEVL